MTPGDPRWEHDPDYQTYLAFMKQARLGFDASAVPRRSRYFAFRGCRAERHRAQIAHLVQPYPKRITKPPRISVSVAAIPLRIGAIDNVGFTRESC